MLALLALLPLPAAAHAFLDEAVPKVGSTGNAPPFEIRLKFTEGIEADFSHVVIQRGDTPLETADPVADPHDPSVLIVHPAVPLAPGEYRVKWAVVSVDTHHTNGAYSFAVGP